MLERISVGPLGENCYILPLNDGRSCILVDPGDEANRILDFLESRNLTISLIVATHGHLDHTAAIPEIVKNQDAKGLKIPLAIHQSDAGYLGEHSESTNRELFNAIRALGYFESYWRPLPAADLLLADGDILQGSTWTVIHTPGHTRGSICLYDANSEVLVSGDTLFLDGVGRTDGPDSDGEALGRSLSILFSLPPATMVLPGHGEHTTIAHERSFRS